MGVMDRKSHKKSRLNYLKVFEKHDIDIHITYEKSIMRVLSSVIQSKLVAKHKIENEKMTANVYNETIGSLKEGNNVMLIGHSYGGAIVSRVAEKLNMCPIKDVVNLQVATFGSICISDAEDVRNICMKQFMFTNDIMLKFNNLKYDDSHVTWLYVGDRGKWSAHNSYAIISVILAGDVNKYPVTK
jgi:electron transfer flavoprotein alpha subunit